MYYEHFMSRTKLTFSINSPNIYMIYLTYSAKSGKIIDYAYFSESADNCLTQGVQKQLPVQIRYWRTYICVYVCVHKIRSAQ